MFTKQTLSFIAQNHLNASREWFGAHKDEYVEYVQKPLYDLAYALAPTIKQIDPALITDPKSCVSRIYRDMRFAKNGSPYRDMQWLSFRHDKKAFPNRPEFYFVLSPCESFFGCGYYMAKADSMAQVRKLILKNDETFTAAQAVLKKQEDFYLDGEMYKKSRYSQYPPALQNWLDRKTVCCSCSPSLDALFDENLAERVRTAYLAMKPVYAFLMHAEKCGDF